MQLFNSLHHKKEQFIPLEENKVKIYVCGQTVYDYCHLGHARKAIVFDMIRRWFIASGFEVIFVENITDIDDKIIKRSIENKEAIDDLTKRYTDYMHEDFAKLGVMLPDIEPKATEHIQEIIKVIEGLIEKGFAYLADNGDVYYRVRKFKDYGKLSGKTPDSLISGIRVEIDKYKEDPLDFVLWKAAKEHEPYYDSNFGKGRPGWHIECSAMANKVLGNTFDIHGGGQDLQFPHHENEIAQSEAYNECKFANYWMHNGFLNINDEKMSKSLGNFFTVREVLKKVNPEVLRFFMLKTHYRSPLNFDEESLHDSKASLTRIYNAIKNFDINLDKYQINWQDNYANKFKLAMDDDFNTPLAISILFEMVGEINKNHDIGLANQLVLLANTIGILNSDAEDFLHGDVDIDANEIESMIEKRNQARKDKDFALSDKIRDDLQNMGIILEDSASGTSWRKVT